MRALRKTRPARGAELLEIPVPPVGPNDVLVRVRAAAICGTDIHIYNWNPWAAQRIKIPRTFGHEFCGEVVQVGERVFHLKPGDLIAAETHVPCGHCFQCQTGNQHVCESMAILGVHVEGTFSDLAAIPAVCGWKLPPGTDPELGAVMEPLGVATHGLLVEPLEVGSVAIVGCGPIGIFAAQVAATLGAGPLFVLDINEDRLAMASRIVPGSIGFNPAAVDAVAAVRDANRGRLVDVAVELSGSVAGTKLALALASIGGRVSLVGLTGEPVPILTTDSIVYKELTIKGTTGRHMWKTWWQMDRLLAAGAFDPRRVVTHRFSLADYEAAFELATSGKAGKILLIP